MKTAQATSASPPQTPLWSPLPRPLRQPSIDEVAFRSISRTPVHSYPYTPSPSPRNDSLHKISESIKSPSATANKWSIPFPPPIAPSYQARLHATPAFVVPPIVKSHPLPHQQVLIGSNDAPVVPHVPRTPVAPNPRICILLSATTLLIGSWRCDASNATTPRLLGCRAYASAQVFEWRVRAGAHMYRLVVRFSSIDCIVMYGELRHDDDNDGDDNQPPLACLELRLRDAPELAQWHTDVGTGNGLWVPAVANVTPDEIEAATGERVHYLIGPRAALVQQMRQVLKQHDAAGLRRVLGAGSGAGARIDWDRFRDAGAGTRTIYK